ncbi:MAG: hypothetical protein JXC32_12990, partial [Anaerolineae bacterium]|nr:hypothetical protein [Anaerolineae bacterium]
ERRLQAVGIAALAAGMYICRGVLSQAGARLAWAPRFSLDSGYDETDSSEAGRREGRCEDGAE